MEEDIIGEVQKALEKFLVQYKYKANAILMNFEFYKVYAREVFELALLKEMLPDLTKTFGTQIILSPTVERFQVV